MDIDSTEVAMAKLVHRLEKQSVNGFPEDMYLLGNLNPNSAPLELNNYTYSQWKAKGFGKKKARLLSSLNFHTHTSIKKLLKITESKNLNSLTHLTNKQLKEQKMNLKVVTKQNIGKKLENLTSKH